MGAKQNVIHQLFISLILPYTISRFYTLSDLGMRHIINPVFRQTGRIGVHSPVSRSREAVLIFSRVTDSSVVFSFHLDHLLFSRVSLDILRNHFKVFTTVVIT